MIERHRSREALLALLLALSCHVRLDGSSAQISGDRVALAVRGATIHPSPEAAPIPQGVVVVRDGLIVEVGPAGGVRIPDGATVIDGEAMHLFAGFQNSHVHFTEPKWEGAAVAPSSQLEKQLEDMLLRFGFTTVVDTGSNLVETTALRRRIDSGELRGPRILTAGTPLYPADGVPYYLKSSLPPEALASLNTPGTPDEAADVVARQIAAGADIVKLFTGSWVERGRVLPMPAEIARAAAGEAHRRGKLVFSHASNLAGLEAAMAAGVDVVAHALDDDRGWDATHAARMKARGMALIPTLELFGGQPYTPFIQDEVRDFARAGGQILFGTDVGYLTDYDPGEEYVLMSGAGLDWRQILASLTTAPSERFGEEGRRGRIAPGMDADLVVLARDPALDVKAFADVVYSIRGGRVVFENRGAVSPRGRR